MDRLGFGYLLLFFFEKEYLVVDEMKEATLFFLYFLIDKSLHKKFSKNLFIITQMVNFCACE